MKNLFLFGLLFIVTSLKGQYTNDRYNTEAEFASHQVDSIFYYDSLPGESASLSKIEVLDFRGNVVKEINSENDEYTLNHYNTEGKIVSSYFYSNFENDNQVQLIWIDTFDYNQEGKLIQFTNHQVMLNERDSRGDVYEYRNDSLIKSITFFNGEKTFINLYSSDSRRKIKREVRFNYKGMIDSSIFVYNEKGHLTAYYTYDMKRGPNTMHHLYKVDDLGHRLWFKAFNSDGTLEQFYEYSFNSKGLCTLSKATTSIMGGNTETGEVSYTIIKYSFRKN